MRNGILVMLVLMCFFTYAQIEKPIEWGNLASINPTLLEEKAKDYLITQKPELKGVEIKFINMSAQYNVNHGSSLDVTFIHANSFKPMDENQTLGTIGDNYGIKFYIEHIFVEFSQEGEPVKLEFQEVLLGKERESSKEDFLKHYNSF